MLELACMKDEPLPEKRVVTQAGHAAPSALMVSTNSHSPDAQLGSGIASGESS